MNAASQTHAARDVLVVDLGSLKASLVARAAANGVSLSYYVRTLLSDALGGDVESAEPAVTLDARSAEDRVRVSLRMVPLDAKRLAEAARRAGLPLGPYVCGLAAGVPVLASGASRPDLIAALASAASEMSTLSRYLAHLVELTKRGSLRAAQEYSETWTRLDMDVRRQLALVAQGLAELQPPKVRASNRRIPTAARGGIRNE